MKKYAREQSRDRPLSVSHVLDVGFGSKRKFAPNAQSRNGR
jgi:hypothetical protein